LRLRFSHTKPEVNRKKHTQVMSPTPEMREDFAGEEGDLFSSPGQPTERGLRMLAAAEAAEKKKKEKGEELAARAAALRFGDEGGSRAEGTGNFGKMREGTRGLQFEAQNEGQARAGKSVESSVGEGSYVFAKGATAANSPTEVSGGTPMEDEEELVETPRRRAPEDDGRKEKSPEQKMEDEFKEMRKG
jgi:hypothetical protein